MGDERWENFDDLRIIRMTKKTNKNLEPGTQNAERGTLNLEL